MANDTPDALVERLLDYAGMDEASSRLHDEPVLGRKFYRDRAEALREAARLLRERPAPEALRERIAHELYVEDGGGDGEDLWHVESEAKQQAYRVAAAKVLRCPTILAVLPPGEQP